VSRRMRERTRQAIAATLTGGGAWAFVLIAKLFGVLRSQWPTAVAEGEQLVVVGNGAILLVFIALASSAIVGGVLLWKDRPLGRLLGKIVLAAQVVFVAVPHFQYKVALLGFLGFGLTGSRVGVFFESGTQMFLEFDPDDLRGFVVNIPALVMLGLLVKHPKKAAESKEASPLEGSSSGADTG
jgi:hypothetical protein